MNASARQLADKCGRDLPYQWLCGGAPVNYHSLSDFYRRHGVALHRLFIEHIAALRQQGLIPLHTVTLDGRPDADRRGAGLDRHRGGDQPGFR